MSAPLRARRTVSRRARRSLTRRARNGLTAWLFALPFAILFLAFTVGPVISSFTISFTDMKSSDLRHPFDVNFVGLQNFTTLFGDPQFIRVVGNTLIFVVVGVPLTLIIGLALALALNSGITRLKGVFRVGYYVPVVTNVIAVAVVWRYMLQPNGLADDLLAAVGIDGPNFLFDTAWAMPSVIALGVWRNFGTVMVIFLAGLQSLPTDVYEAASLDGAGPWRRLVSITLPLLNPTTLLASVLMCTFFLQVFDEPYVLTGGGPLDSTNTIALFTYQQFGFGSYGIAAAASYVLLALVVIVNVVQFRVLRSRH